MDAPGSEQCCQCDLYKGKWHQRSCRHGFRHHEGRKDIKVSYEVNKNWIIEDGIELTDNVVAKGLQSIQMPGQVVIVTPLETEVKTENSESK